MLPRGTTTATLAAAILSTVGIAVGPASGSVTAITIAALARRPPVLATAVTALAFRLGEYRASDCRHHG